MNMSDVMQPAWWLATKRGVGMAMVGVSYAVPTVAGWLCTAGYACWAVTSGDVEGFSNVVMSWMESTGYLIGMGLWAWGSWRPSSPLTLTKNPV